MKLTRSTQGSMPGSLRQTAPPHRPLHVTSQPTVLSRHSLPSSLRLSDPRRSTGIVHGLLSTAQDQEQWWTKDEQYWTKVHSAEDFEREINNTDKLVLIDFYATWCKGCAAVYPKLSLMASDAHWNKRIKFVKVNSDELKALAKDLKATALPYIVLHRPKLGTECSFPLVLSRLPTLKANLEVVLNNEGQRFDMDPNGYVQAAGPRRSAEENAAVEQKKMAELKKMETQKSSLFEHLMNVANQAGKANKDAAAAPAPPLAPSSPLPADGSNYAAAKQAFLQRFEGYGYGLPDFDALWQRELGDRMRDQHYMDYTGASVYTKSQLKNVFEDLNRALYGNPHSANPSSSLTADQVEAAREMVLKYFHADPAEYQVVFTRSATGALKLVGETFPWTQGSKFHYLRENHNSVLGMREYCREHGGAFKAVTEEQVDEWLATAPPPSSPPPAAPAAPPTYSLFAFPAEDNFAGVKYPLTWVERARAQSDSGHRWKVLVDAAAFVPTNPLDLSKCPADFVTMSFYKIFGYPTGLGALLIRTEDVSLLHKLYWGGGSVALATSTDNFHVLRCKPSDRLEDGTVAFLDIIALQQGFKGLDSLGGMPRVQVHAMAVATWLYEGLRALRHKNGRAVATIFGKHALGDPTVQGPVVNFALIDAAGHARSYKEIEKRAAAAGFHVRTGSECNPGACYAALGLRDEEIEALAEEKEGCDDDVEYLAVKRSDVESVAMLRGNPDIPNVIHVAESSQGPDPSSPWVNVPLGTVRASFGYMSRFEDVFRFLEFVKANYVE